jgi:oligopeptide/dipeptide ABC transporter ATP-binding protein
MTSPGETTPLLQVDGLDVHFRSRGKTPVAAVTDLSFSVNAGETVALVGESGCGKSTTALALLGLLPTSTASVRARTLRFAGRDLTALREAEWHALRGGDIAMIFQDPLSALNPVRTIGTQLIESIRLHRGLRGREARTLAVELLDRVHIPEAARRLDDYPHRLSGGMRQRVLIAMALAGRPRLLLADEPTTALDVTIQAQILRLLEELQRDEGTSVLLITHDLGVVAQTAHRVVVMYAGRAVESRSADALFAQPFHPYTQRLMRARPTPLVHQARLEEIAGAVPRPGQVTGGCAFAPRCTEAIDACIQAEPPELQVEGGTARCIRIAEMAPLDTKRKPEGIHV